jgi:HSP20 family protein
MFGLVPWKKSGNGTALANRNDHPLSLFRNEFDTLFDRFFGPEPDWAGVGLEADETEKDVTVRMDAPGFEPGDFDIRVSGETLRITAERKSHEGTGRFERRVQRAVTLPAAVNADKVEATYKNGGLELILPKSEQARGKKIAVRGG